MGDGGLRIEALAGYEPEIGRWLWALEAVRARTRDALGGIDQRTLDWEGPDGGENAIGSLLYHIALVEMSWLHLDVLERAFPPSVAADLPHPMGSGGRMTRLRGVAPAAHLDRLARGRQVLLASLRGMTPAEWERPRVPRDAPYRVTPAWAVYHLVEHEAGHAGQIAALRARAGRFFAGGAAAT